MFNEHLGSQDKVIAALQGFAIVCAMRERTAFPHAVIEALPDLKLLITTGMRNASIDLEAAKARGVVVCGTPAFGNATAAIAIGLMLELTRHIGYENARLKAGAVWQTTIGLDLEGMTLALLGLGKLGGRVAAIGVVAARFLAVATNLHIAPAATAIAALVEKEPGAIRRFTHAHGSKLGRDEQVRCRLCDRP